MSLMDEWIRQARKSTGGNICARSEMEMVLHLDDDFNVRRKSNAPDDPSGREVWVPRCFHEESMARRVR